MKILERRYWCRSTVFIINFEQILHIVDVFIFYFEQFNTG